MYCRRDVVEFMGFQDDSHQMILVHSEPENDWLQLQIASQPQVIDAKVEFGAAGTCNRMQRLRSVDRRKYQQLISLNT